MPASRLPSPASPSPTLAIVGGGLAGLSAAVAAIQRGWRVTLFERSKMLGGRASSFLDSTLNCLVDYSQHVAMGCCSSFLDFCRRTGIEDCFQRQRRLHFIAPDGSQHDFASSRILPAPLHLLPALMRLKFLSLADRLRILPAMRKLTAQGFAQRDEALVTWLHRHHQSSPSVDRFWSTVVVSALGETVENASTAAAAKVFRDGFLASRHAADLLLPSEPLGEIFHGRVGVWLEHRGVKVELQNPISRIETQQQRGYLLTVSKTDIRPYDAAIVAVPWHEAGCLFSDELRAQMPFFDDAEKLAPAAITAVHFWFDRPAIPLAHAALIDRLSQWVFTQKCLFSETSKAAEKVPVFTQHCQVVISAAHRLPQFSHVELLAKIRGELESIWPAVRDARLLHSRLLTQPKALFSVQPDSDCLRPRQQTPLPRLALAGDWTSTGWPATMEGAIRSGRLAVESLQNDPESPRLA